MANKPTQLNLLHFFFLLLIIRSTTVHGRLSTTRPSLSDAISDGVHDHVRGSPPFLLQFFASESCTLTYGFVPCTTTVFGNLFLILVYGYLMFVAARYLSKGSDLLSKILGPAKVEGLIIPILGAVPDAVLILASGLSGSTETAQSQVSIGMGLLAGLTIAVLTIIWGSCVVAGKCDIGDDSLAKDEDTKGFCLTGSGISTDCDSSNTIAKIMVPSIVPFIIVQIPQVFHSTLGRHLAVLISFISSLLLFISYCLYQGLQPSIRKRSWAFAMHKDSLSRFLNFLGSRLASRDAQAKEEIIKKLFTLLDKNGDGQLSVAELKKVIKEIWFDEIDWDVNDATDKLMQYFDKNNDQHINEHEFVDGISSWHEHQSKINEDLSKHQCSEGESDHDNVKVAVVDVRIILTWTMFKAVSGLILGTFIACVFANPLVDAIDNLSNATTIPSFFISFVALPLATNLSEAVSIIITAGKKTRMTACFSFSEIYGTVIVNNLLSLTVLSGLVHFRGLTWDFSAEVLTTILVCLVVSAFASFRTTYPLWTALVAFLLYPLSMALIYVLQYVAGWT